MSWGEDELNLGFSDEEWRARNCYNKRHTPEGEKKDGEILPDKEPAPRKARRESKR